MGRNEGLGGLATPPSVKGLLLFLLSLNSGVHRMDNLFPDKQHSVIFADS